MRWAMKLMGTLGLAATLALTGCGTRQGVDTVGLSPDAEGGSPAARQGLTDEPTETYVHSDDELREIIEEGGTANTNERPDSPPEDEHDDDHGEETDEAETVEAPQMPDAPDTSDDQQWMSINNPVVAVETSKGVFYLELYPDVAPNHVENMIKLNEIDFYNGIFFHRVEPGFVVQAGDPNTKVEGPFSPTAGQGGPGYTIDAEFNDKPHLRGTLSMARTNDPNSAGSQWFVCLDRTPFLDNQYTVFGQVLGNGMDVVDEIEVGDQIYFMRTIKEG